MKKCNSTVSLVIFLAVVSITNYSFIPSSKCCFKKDTVIRDNPLAFYSAAWNAPLYNNCNTASSVTYMTKSEKNLIWTINMIRLNPLLFINTVLNNPKCSFYYMKKDKNKYFLSLVKDLQNLKPNKNYLIPDSSAFVSAKCHAYTSGINGTIGHERNPGECTKDFYGECCDYGYDDPVNILLHLLIDENISNLGHREICLSPRYLTVACSIQPHKVYGTNAVIDFKF
jgi:hypothetical protein